MLPEKIAEVREWVQKAAEDLGVAEHILSAKLPYFGPVLFHCQQAAEKMLKAYLIWHDQPFRKTHELEVLLTACTKIDQGFSTLVPAAKSLTRYAVDQRYPGSGGKPNLRETEDALVLARGIYDFVVGYIPPDVKP